MWTIANSFCHAMDRAAVVNFNFAFFTLYIAHMLDNITRMHVPWYIVAKPRQASMNTFSSANEPSHTCTFWVTSNNYV